MLIDHLALAERHVAEGATILERQRALIKERSRAGQSVEDAEELLRSMEETQEMHIADRERIRRELAKLD